MFTAHFDEKKTVEFVSVAICVRSYRLNTVLLGQCGGRKIRIFQVEPPGDNGLNVMGSGNVNYVWRMMF